MGPAPMPRADWPPDLQRVWAQASPAAQTWVSDYLQHVRVDKRLAARTQNLYAHDLAKLLSHCQAAHIDLAEVTPGHVRRWVGQMRSQGRSARGINLILSGWRSFYRWLGGQAVVAANPVQDVRGPKQAKPLPKALGVEEAMQLADARPSGRADDALGLRDQAMVELLYGCGLRLGELLGLDHHAGTRADAGWLDLAAADAHVLGKGSKRRMVPMGRAAVAAVQAWLSVRGLWAVDGEDALFISRRGQRLSANQARLRLRQRSLQAGLAAPVHPHMLRHSFASHVLQSSQDLRAVQELLGHASISSTQGYTRLDFQHLAQAYDRAHPKARKKTDA